MQTSSITANESCTPTCWPERLPIVYRVNPKRHFEGDEVEVKQ